MLAVPQLTQLLGASRRTDGLGALADNFLPITARPAGLWIASDNDAGTCGGVSGLAGICFLSYSSWRHRGTGYTSTAAWFPP